MDDAHRHYNPAAHAVMHARLSLAFGCLLLLVRLPSIVQPMGADQGLYAYVGERILAGELPYRDAWDQKPPAIHYVYAALRGVWPHDTVVGAADLLAAAATAWLLFRLGAAIGGAQAGVVSAILFLFLSNPAFTRLAGIRLRAQCETFMALAVTGAFLLLARRRVGQGNVGTVGAGVLFGLAFMFKYNAGLYAAAGVAALWLWRRLTWGDVLRMAVGFAVLPAATLLVFGQGGALRDLYDGTIAYNVRYSGQTYDGTFDAIRYLAAFPLERARVDALWTLGGAGCLILIVAAIRGMWTRAEASPRHHALAGVGSGAHPEQNMPGDRRGRLLPVVWLAAACLSIAVNGSRGLPQYFVQANPALALAAGWGAALAWPLIRARAGRAAGLVGAAVLLVVSLAVWRVNQFPKLVEQTVFDAGYALGRTPRRDYLARYADDRKYSSIAAADLADLVRARTAPSDRIYVFGFTCAAYVDGGRASASRFFWSRPVIVGFNAGAPGYGVEGLLSDLRRHPPALVALQRKDWAPDVTDSAEFFMSTPALAGWLQSGYEREAGTDAFDVWVRRVGAP